MAVFHQERQDGTCLPVGCVVTYDIHCEYEISLEQLSFISDNYKHTGMI